MGGNKTTTTQTPQIPPELRQLYGMQTNYLSNVLPQAQQLTTDVMSGNSMATNPYVAGLYSTIAKSGEQAADAARQRTPRGPGQDYAVANAYRSAAEQRGQLDSKMKEWVAQQLFSMIAGVNPQAQIGSTTVQKQPSEFGVSLGPFSYSGAL